MRWLGLQLGRLMARLQAWAAAGQTCATCECWQDEGAGDDYRECRSVEYIDYDEEPLGPISCAADDLASVITRRDFRCPLWRRREGGTHG